MGKEKRKEMNFWTKEEYETFAKAAMKKMESIKRLKCYIGAEFVWVNY